MVFLPCPSPISPISVTSCGTNTCHKSQITSQSNQLDVFKTPLMVPSFIVRTNMLPLFEYSALPVLRIHREDIPRPSIFESLSNEPSSIVTSLVESLQCQHGRAYPWAVGSGRQLPSGYILAKRKKDFRSGRPIISFVDSPFRPMLKLIFQLIPTACPNHFATGDVYTLLSILRSAPVDADLILVNQDLAGFFTSIDQDRFLRSCSCS